MSMHALLTSNVLLWVFLLGQSIVILALIRQVGVVHERIKPAGALMLDHGPAVGSPAPMIDAFDLSGAAVRIGGVGSVAGPVQNTSETLLFFMSPTCPVCKSLLPILSAMQRARDDLGIILISDGERDQHIQFYENAKLRLPYVLSADAGMFYRIGKLPYAVLLDGGGILRAKGLVNTREHVESLFEARKYEVASQPV